MVNLQFRSFFAYFDENKCRWETEQDSCDDNVTDSDETSSDDTDSEISSNTDGEDASDSDTNVVEESSSGDVTDVTDTIGAHTTDENTDLTIDVTQKPLYQNLECEPLGETWMCSSGSKNHSLCIKFCTVGLDLLRFQSYLMIYDRLSTMYRFFHVKIQKRWSIRTKEMYMQAKRMLLGPKKSKMSDNDR